MHIPQTTTGVPAFFRWLSEKYPKTVINMIEQRPHMVDGITVRGSFWSGRSLRSVSPPNTFALAFLTPGSTHRTYPETQVPLDLTQPNPNNMEFDNMYIDMNGIIHPCSHPEDRPMPVSLHAVRPSV